MSEVVGRLNRLKHENDILKEIIYERCMSIISMTETAESLFEKKPDEAAKYFMHIRDSILYLKGYAQ
jgi:hypothetical protein